VPPGGILCWQDRVRSALLLAAERRAVGQHVQDADFLFVVAEIAVAFAGFASIVAVLGQRSTHDHAAVEASRLRGLIEFSLVTVTFSLLPYVAARLSDNHLAAWRVSSGLFFVVGLLLLHGFYGRRRLLSNLGIPLRVRIMVFGFYLAPLPLLLLIAVGVAGNRSPGAYLLSLLCYLLGAAIAFFRVILSFVAALREDSEPDA